MDAVAEILASRCLVAGARNQWALAEWLRDPASDASVRMRRERLTDNRKRVLDGLMRLPGIDSCEISRGAATPFVTFQVPHPYRSCARPTEEFLNDCADRGIVLSCMTGHTRAGECPFGQGMLRMYIGADPAMLGEALERMAAIPRLRGN